MSQAREIEVKYRVDDPAALEAELRRRGVHPSSPIHQDDQTYAQDGWRYGMGKLGVSSPDCAPKTAIICSRSSDPRITSWPALEFETEVADP